MGKYTKLKQSLPKFELPAEFAERVENAKGEMIGASIKDLARTFALWKKRKDEHEESIKTLNVSLEAVSQLLVEALQTEELGKITTDNGATVYIKDEPYSAVENLEELEAYLKKNKMEALKKLPWQTMNAMNKSNLESGRPLLPGTKIWMKTAAALRNGNAEE